MHCKSYSHFFSKKFQHICISLDLNFNESLTNDAVSFEQLGPGPLEFEIMSLLFSFFFFFFFFFHDGAIIICDNKTIEIYFLAVIYCYAGATR